ncbi:MAG: rRNA maturation RNase YbeY [bacterium]
MINFEISQSVKSPVNGNWLKTIVKVFASVLKIKSGYFSLAFISAEEMRKLNYSYRGKDKVTDVLSFEEFNDIPTDDKQRFLGEVIICPDQLKKQAKEYGVSIKAETARLLVHGLVHLMGYDHENVSQKEEQKMVTLEQKILVKLKV